MASVQLSDISKSYGLQRVVDGIDLAVAHGELVCLLGPSGCGKTTTLRLIAGFVAPDAGTIRVGERVLSGPGTSLPPERRNMSMIFQSYALWPHMTVAENVAYGLKLRRLPAAQIKAKTQAALALARLADFADRSPAELSGGQQQRVALARAMAVEPETLLLDEPLSNLDANLREEMRFEIRRLHDELRYTTIYVTHDQAEAMTAADRIVVMNRGRIEQIGTPQEVYEEPASEFVARFIGGTNILRGEMTDGMVCSGPLTLHCANALPNGRVVPVSIRPHQVELHRSAAPPPGPNVFSAIVRRHTYLGSQRDYLVALEGGAELRVAAPIEAAASTGDTVFVRLPPERCRALPA